MSSSPAIEQSPPPTTPSSPAQRAAAHLDYLQQCTSTPNYIGRKPNPPLNVILPTVGPSTPPIPSCEPTPTPPPRSPGAPCVAHAPPDGTSSDKSSETAVVGPGPAPSSAGALSRKESYKAQRQHYRREKKRAASALLHSIEDPAAIVLADWLKVRGSLKSWTKLWCVLKPGLLLLYKSPKAKSSHWVGTVLLTSCQVIERPSKKDGFCFKLYHPLEQSIWAPRGPHNETIGAVVQPLPTAHLIFRAPSQEAGHCWLDGLELALRCSNAMLRCSRSRGSAGSAGGPGDDGAGGAAPSAQLSHEELEKHFNEHELAGAASDSDTDSGGGAAAAGAEAPAPLGAPGSGGADARDVALRRRREVAGRLDQLYADDALEDIGVSGELVEEVTEENKSLLWFLVKQVRPGMDLSKVVLPTFILEPRSFLDKLSDNYYHADLLASASHHDDPYCRFKGVLKWYLSGMYKKPRGLKKPYNPVLGEIFRCRWRHPRTHTYTYYIAEQVSHHPPVSAFYVTNREEGFVIQGSLLARSKFYGNSTSAILEGCARVYLLRWGEAYITTAPYAQCKGIVIGTLSMELGGKVVVFCPNTGYSADIEFKLKSFLGSSDQTNAVTGKIKKGGATIATVDGYWDGRIDIKEKQTGEESNLIDVAALKEARLQRSRVRLNRQHEFESQRLWSRVSEAILNEDQVTATEEKTIIEEAQRERTRKLSGPWLPKYFHKNGALPPPEGIIDQGWLYNHANTRVWDPEDILDYEDSFVIRTLRTSALAGGGAPGVSPVGSLMAPSSSGAPGPRQLSSVTGMTGVVASASRLSQAASDSDSRDGVARRTKTSTRTLKQMLANIDTTLQDQTEAIDKLTRTVNTISERQRQSTYGRRAPSPQRDRTWKLVLTGFVLAIVLQAFVGWLFAPAAPAAAGPPSPPPIKPEL